MEVMTSRTLPTKERECSREENFTEKDIITERRSS
jgi:hypothetical protein